ncbi:MAG: glycosyltransferase [Gammaproteobacteria bacterium]
MSYTVIVPAFNEALFLPATLQALAEAMTFPDMAGNVIVVDNNSTDETAKVATDFGAHVVFEPLNQISRARNAGAAAATTPYLIFVDADTLVSGELLCAALNSLKLGACGGGSTLTFDDVPRSAIVMARLWNWVSRKNKLAAGSFVFCLREGFEAVGGFSEAVYASEEIWFSRSLKKWGRKRDLSFEVVDVAPVVTSGRKLEWFSPLRLTAQSLALVFFPFLVRFKSMCAIWYRRPDK